MVTLSYHKPVLIGLFSPGIPNLWGKKGITGNDPGIL